MNEEELRAKVQVLVADLADLRAKSERIQLSIAGKSFAAEDCEDISPAQRDEFRKAIQQATAMSALMTSKIEEAHAHASLAAEGDFKPRDTE